MKMNSRQNCIIMIGIFYSFEKFIPEIINEGPHITSRCRIEKISSPFLGSYLLSLKIIQILKVGKQNLFNSFHLSYAKIRVAGSKYLFFSNNFNFYSLTAEGGILFFCVSLSIIWLLVYNLYFITAGLINSKYFTALNAGLCYPKYSTTPSNIERSPFWVDYHNKKKDFRSECKNIFKLHKSYDKIKYELNILISRYAGILLLGKSYKSLSFLKNYIHKRSWLWAKKKHKKVGKNMLFNFYFKDNKFKVLTPIASDGAQKVESFISPSAAYFLSGVSFNYQSSVSESRPEPQRLGAILNNSNDSQVDLQNNTEGQNRLSTLAAPASGRPDDLLAPWPLSFLTPGATDGKVSQDLQFINVEKEYQNIIFKLNSLSSGGIYLFWLLDDPTKIYVGSAINLKKRFYTHYNNSLINNNHPKFYNCVKKYGWSNFGFLILELIEDKSLLIEKENILLNKIFNNPSFIDNSLNILKFGNSWLNNKHSDKTKKLISDKMKGKKLSEQHKLNISKSLTNKKLSNETKF